MALRVPKAELTGFTGAMIKWMGRRMFGEVPEPAEVMWHHPRLVRTFMRFGGKVEGWDAADATLKSFAQMAVAAQVGCGWCLDLGYFKARNDELDLAKASQVPRWRESDVFTPLERDVMEYAEAMTQTTPTVTDELSARLLEALGPAALVELTGFIAFANFTARTNVAFGIGSGGFSDRCQLPPLARRADGVSSSADGVASAA